MRTILRRAALGSIVIGAGLALRAYGAAIGLSFPLVKYCGSVLWGTMVFFLVVCPHHRVRAGLVPWWPC